MSALNILGLVMVAIPFVGLFLCTWSESGIKVALGVFGSVGFLFGFLILGIYLLIS